MHLATQRRPDLAGPERFGLRFLSDRGQKHLLGGDPDDALLATGLASGISPGVCVSHGVSTGVSNGPSIGPSTGPSTGPTAPSARVGLRLAGTACEIVGLDPHQAAEIRTELAGHLEADLEEDLESHSAKAAPHVPPGGSQPWELRIQPVARELFRSPEEAAAADRDAAPEPDEAFWDYFLDLEATTDHVRCAGLDFLARLERPPSRRLTAFLAEGVRGGRLRQAVLNLLRILATFAVAEEGGLLLHSAAFVSPKDLRRDPRQIAVVCPGRSGAGKSTLAALATGRGWQVLSDELNVVWMPEAAERPSVEQVPFTGDLGRLAQRPGRFPVAAVWPIVRTGRDERPALSAAELYSRVLAEAVFANGDPQTVPRLEATTARLVGWALENGRLESLSFTPGGDLPALSALLGETP